MSLFFLKIIESDKRGLPRRRISARFSERKSNYEISRNFSPGEGSQIFTTGLDKVSWSAKKYYRG